MEDFAAAAMLRLIRAGLIAQGLPPPDLPPTPGARVPLAAKRAVLAGIAARHGPGVLLRLGEGVRHVTAEPALTALALATDPADLMARWNRLERFVHARHRTVWRGEGPGALAVEHVAIGGHEPPTVQEDLLVLGLLAVLCEGAAGVPLTVGTQGSDAVLREGGRWTEAAPPEAGAVWVFGWGEKQAAPMPGIGAARALSLSLSPGGRGDATSIVLPSPPRGEGTGARGAPPRTGHPSPTASARLLDIITTDPSRRWSLGDLATSLGTTPRTLQKRLLAEGTGLTPLVAAVRASEAARLLATTAASLGEIGFVCGFADQPHFTRAFRRFTGLTPAVWRAQFGRGVTPAR
jgi:AraC-like DNA-binding protein